MKKKDLLYVALGLTVGAGVYYMGKAKIMKSLFADGLIKEEKSNDGNINTKITVKAKSLIDTSLKAPDNYWLTEGVEGNDNVFYDNNGNKIMYDKDGNIKIGLIDSVKTGLKSLIFWK